VGQDLGGAQESNRHVFGSPEPVSGSCEKPILPQTSRHRVHMLCDRDGHSSMFCHETVPTTCVGGRQHFSFANSRSKDVRRGLEIFSRRGVFGHVWFHANTDPTKLLARQRRFSSAFFCYKILASPSQPCLVSALVRQILCEPWAANLFARILAANFGWAHRGSIQTTP
jgi:hypothetical protein